MTGLTNYTANSLLNYVTGQTPTPSLPAVWLALFTAVGTDAASGFTEVSGGSYARVQVAGAVAATASFTAASPNITMTTNPGWVLPGMSVYDTTKTPAPGAFVGTVLTYSGTALVLTGNAAIASQGSTDNLTFSAFGQSTGTGPSTVTNGASLAFATATATWGTVVAFGLYDAVTSGNLTAWDFIGNFSWLPFESTSVNTGNGPVLTVKGNAYTNLNPVVLTAEYGGTLPTLTTGTITGYTVNFVANQATDSITLTVTSGATALAATSTGSGMIRQIVQQSIPNGVTATFAASTLTITAA